MKKKLRLVLSGLLLAAAVLGCQAPGGGTTTAKSWQVVGSVGFSEASVEGTNLAIDSSDNCYVVYDDYAHGRKATVMKYAGGSWQSVGSVGFSAGQVGRIRIAVDSSGVPYVAYADATTYKADVMEYSGTGVTGWQSAGASFSATTADSICLAISSATPYIAYQTGASAHVMVSGWSEVGSSLSGNITGLNSLSLAVDSSGSSYVAYSEGITTVQMYASGAWHVLGSTPGAAFSNSLALDPSGILYHAYNDYTNSKKATVRKYTGGSWQVVGSEGFSAGEVQNVSLAIDSSGTPYIAYEDVANSQKATVMVYTGGSWQVVGSVGFSAGGASDLSLALDSSGTPYVAYGDVANNNKATVMCFK